MDWESFFFAHRGSSVDARTIEALCGGDPAEYRHACKVARGNNVAIRQAYKPRIDTNSDHFREITREMTEIR